MLYACQVSLKKSQKRMLGAFYNSSSLFFSGLYLIRTLSTEELFNFSNPITASLYLSGMILFAITYGISCHASFYRWKSATLEQVKIIGLVGKTLKEHHDFFKKIAKKISFFDKNEQIYNNITAIESNYEFIFKAKGFYFFPVVRGIFQAIVSASTIHLIFYMTAVFLNQLNHIEITPETNTILTLLNLTFSLISMIIISINNVSACILSYKILHAPHIFNGLVKNQNNTITHFTRKSNLLKSKVDQLKQNTTKNSIIILYLLAASTNLEAFRYYYKSGQKKIDEDFIKTLLILKLEKEAHIPSPSNPQVLIVNDNTQKKRSALRQPLIPTHHNIQEDNSNKKPLSFYLKNMFSLAIIALGQTLIGISGPYYFSVELLGKDSGYKYIIAGCMGFFSLLIHCKAFFDFYRLYFENDFEHIDALELEKLNTLKKSQKKLDKSLENNTKQIMDDYSPDKVLDRKGLQDYLQKSSPENKKLFWSDLKTLSQDVFLEKYPAVVNSSSGFHLSLE